MGSDRVGMDKAYQQVATAADSSQCGAAVKRQGQASEALSLDRAQPKVLQLSQAKLWCVVWKGRVHYM